MRSHVPTHTPTLVLEDFETSATSDARPAVGGDECIRSRIGWSKSNGLVSFGWWTIGLFEVHPMTEEAQPAVRLMNRVKYRINLNSNGGRQLKLEQAIVVFFSEHGV